MWEVLVNSFSQERMVDVEEARSLICEICRNMYRLGWVSGTGGGMSIQAKGGDIVMAPSAVQKERMQPEDMFILSCEGDVKKPPDTKVGDAKPKLSECAPLFMAVGSWLMHKPMICNNHFEYVFGKAYLLSVRSWLCGSRRTESLETLQRLMMLLQI